MVYNDWRMTLTGPDGKAQQSSGKAIEVVRRQADGSWKYVVDDPNARG
jgi:ketosteroid isomerase-like protein